MTTIGSLSYNETSTVSTPITLERQLRYSHLSSTVEQIEFWANADATSEPQVETITISALPVSNAYLRVEVDGPTVTGQAAVYLVEVITSEGSLTTAKLATRLAKILDSHPDINAVASTNTVALTAAAPGTNGAFTVTVSCLKASDNTTISSIIATATTTAASGTGKVRKWGQFELAVVVDSDGKPQFKIQNGVWYSGAASPASAGNFGPFPFSGPLTCAALRAAA